MGSTDGLASPSALVTVPSMGYAPAPTPTSQPLLPQQPVFVVQEVSPAAPGKVGLSWVLPNLELGAGTSGWWKPLQAQPQDSSA